MAWDWLKNAFAIPRAEDFVATPEQSNLVQKLCEVIVVRGLETPALIFLESSRPLHAIASQFLSFCQPLLSSIGLAGHVEQLGSMLEHPGAIEYIAKTLERVVKKPQRSSE